MPEDSRFWFGKTQELQNQQNRWLRRLWNVLDKPLRPKHWDMRYDMTKRKIRIQNTLPYTWENLQWYTFNTWMQYRKWDLVVYNIPPFWPVVVFEAIIDFPTSLPTNTAERRPTNTYDRVLEEDTLFGRHAVITNNISAPPNTRTNVSAQDAWNTPYYNQPEMRDTFSLSPWFTIPVSDYYLITWKVKRGSIWWQYTTESRIFATLPWWWTIVLDDDSYQLPSITATSITTGTDSVWWSISATTTTTINIWSVINNTNRCHWYWYLEKGTYIQFQWKHNSPINVLIQKANEPDTNQTQDGSYFYLYKTS